VTDLRALLPVEHTARLDWFVGSCLTESGVWDFGRTSDGINGFGHVFEPDHDSVSLWGRVWEVTRQTLHVFWLEVKREGADDRFAWFLYLDVTESSARRQQAPLDRHDNTEDLEWRVKIEGEAIVRDGRLAVVPDSMRAQIRDIEAERKPKRSDRRPRRRRS
jgi:hypothetical protein